jgi:hypothetical protein
LAQPLKDLQVQQLVKHDTTQPHRNLKFTMGLLGLMQLYQCPILFNFLLLVVVAEAEALVAVVALAVIVAP